MAQLGTMLSFADQFPEIILDLATDAKALFHGNRFVSDIEGVPFGKVNREAHVARRGASHGRSSQVKAVQVTPYMIELSNGSGQGAQMCPILPIPDLQFDPISSALESFLDYTDPVFEIGSPTSSIRREPGESAPSSSRSSEQHTCPSCDLIFKRKDSLTLHYRLHTGVRPFVCPDPGCGQAFFSKTARTRHQFSHRSEKQFQCTKCPRRFKMADALLKHAKKHSPASFACHICERRFRRKDNLTVHLLTHSQEKKYQCQICHKQFRQRSGLSFHMRTHEIPRPYQCTLCEKRFSERTSLTKHMSFHESQAENTSFFPSNSYSVFQ